ncbi:hypothetical protein K1T71_012321 [Dendrolimus kikuchii]|uniref:Uncharacterized protein n=1 Tax=Dendrolimus kikuchii TaxID=765133 RepID=A0ACC1CLE4_9NEOP|nr:hypothetical protein K1T71_012321 [Dendrolimus kikuchii]
MISGTKFRRSIIITTRRKFILAPMENVSKSGGSTRTKSRAEESSDSISEFSETCSNYTPPRQDTLKQSYLPKEVNQAFDKSPTICNNLPLLDCVPLSDKSIEPPTNLNCSEFSYVSGSSCSLVVVNKKFIQPESLPQNEAEEIAPNHEVALDINNESQIEDNSNDSITIIQRRKSKSTNNFRDKDYCFYCETFVLNFARHLLRHHIYESDVQKIISKPKKSLERKKLIAALRKKGNYLVNSKEVIKPMRKQKFTDYLPCTGCLGFYSKKLLWKHKKKCTGNKASKNVQSEAQNLLIRHLKIDEKLKETVFPRMRADKISLVAKTDHLICAFGSQYLKTHRERHFVNVVSRKMRELAKLLIEIKKLDPSVRDLFGALRPNLYDIIVEATKILGKYDSEKDRFETPTFAMNMSTTLKQCCNIAIMFALKKEGPYMDVDTGKIEADLKTTIQLIESNWKYDISSQAATDLNKKKWTKITIVPLANDLKILKEYLNKKSLEAVIKIKEGLKNVATYTQLLETVYCRVLLLNRRRPGELQRITLHDYLESQNNASNEYEEFDRALTVSERILVRKFKRVVIRGKRGRGVPVLFNQEVQDDIKLLLSIRNIFFTSIPNQFLFGNPGYENTIYGYKVLERHARLSGAKNPNAISSTRLRKHLATLSQIFSMSENDMEQLATFMGHTNEVHKKSYRLPDDVYQTAKISKLLILMEDGKADAYKGKSLEEIDLDMNEELDEEVLDNNQILDYNCEPTLAVNSDCVQQTCNQNDLSQAGPSGFQTISQQCVNEQVLNTKNKIKIRKKRTLVPWTTEQKKVVTKFFKFHIKNHQPPKRNECEKLKEEHGDLLENKDWLKIKVFVQNTYSKSKK